MIVDNLNELTTPMKRYILALLSLLPGYFIGVPILSVWYVALILFLLLRRIDLIIETFIIWSFIGGGAYHYNLLGDSLNNPFYRFFVYFNLLCLVIAFILSPRDKSDSLMRLLRFGLVLASIALVSSMANGAPIDVFLQYLLLSFRWFLFAYIMFNVDLTNERRRYLVWLLIGVIALNSVFGFTQQLFLPIQVPPDGSELNRLDVASGLLGAYLSQYLTSLCILFASLFVFMFLLKGGMRNAIMAGILLLQPFASSSKSALIVGGVLFVAMMAFLVYRAQVKVIKIRQIVRLGLITFAVMAGLEVYRQTNVEYSFELENVVQDYVESKEALTDFRKVQGYISVTTEVAPTGDLGLLFGVGPGQFTSPLGLSRYNRLVERFEFDSDEGNKVSSVDAKNTDMIEFIGELGFSGGIALVVGLVYWAYFFLRRATQQISSEEVVFCVVISQMVLLVIFNSFYERGLTSPLFFIPMVVLSVYELKRTMPTEVNGNARLPRAGVVGNR